MFDIRREAFERQQRRGLLGFFFAAAVRGGKSAAAVPDFDLESLLMFGAGFAPYSILYRAEAALLKPFLQRGFVVRPLETFHAAFQRGDQERSSKKASCCRKTGVEINRTDDRLVGVGEQPHFFASAGFLLARTEAQMAAQLQPPRRGIDRRCTDKPRQTLRKLSGVPMGKRVAELFAGDQAEDTISEELEALVIDPFRALPMRAVSKSALKPFRVREPMTENRLEFPTLLIGHR
jgi:hypothetical protein